MSTLPPAPIRVACYARVSTEDQAERQTVAAQTDFLRRYCDLHGLPVAGVYVDDGVSGATPLEDRPEGRRLLEDAESGAFTAILVYRLDRLGRSLKSLLAAHERLDAAGVAVRSGTEPFDTASPIGKFLFSLLGSMAELERSTIAERTTRGRDRVAGEGKYTGGPIPLGYELSEDRRLAPSERIVTVLGITEADMVRGIFTRIANGESTLSAEQRRLSALGVPRVQRYGGSKGRMIEWSGKWAISGLAKMVHNPIYRGDGRMASRHGDVTRPTEPLIDADTWERAQRALDRNRRLSTKNARADYLLRGLVVCGLCGMSYVGAGGGRQYRCNGLVGRSNRTVGRCQSVVVQARKLEDAVWQEVRQFVDHPEDHIAEVQRQLRERMTKATEGDEQRRRLAAELAGKEQERERVLGLFRRGRITSDEAERELDAIAAEAGQIRDLIDSLRARVELASAQEAYLSDVGAALARMQDRMAAIERTNDRAAMRELIGLLVPQVVIRTEILGATAAGRAIKRPSAHIRLAFGDECVVVTTTGGSDGRARGRARAETPARW
jgi:site-specific DNA recombinase